MKIEEVDLEKQLREIKLERERLKNELLKEKIQTLRYPKEPYFMPIFLGVIGLVLGLWGLVDALSKKC